jgi:hypothetical protein
MEVIESKVNVKTHHCKKLAGIFILLRLLGDVYAADFWEQTAVKGVCRLNRTVQLGVKTKVEGRSAEQRQRLSRRYSGALPIHAKKRARMGTRQRALVGGIRDDIG